MPVRWHSGRRCWRGSIPSDWTEFGRTRTRKGISQSGSDEHKLKLPILTERREADRIDFDPKSLILFQDTNQDVSCFFVLRL